MNSDDLPSDRGQGLACSKDQAHQCTIWVLHLLSNPTPLRDIILAEVELVTAETVESPELALALEKLSQSLELLSESITISNNHNNELLEKNTEILEGIFQNVSESNDNDSEMAKATRDLAFITFLDAMID